MGAEVERRRTISCHHNYTQQEQHFDKRVWLSRKGAIDASEGNHSRNAARRLFTQADLVERMAGIEWDAQSTAFVDEHPDAHKDIDVVVADAADLVEVRHTLRQVVDVKGD